MDKAKFVKKVDDMAEYEIGKDNPKVTCDGKEYKAEKIERMKTDELLGEEK